MIDSLNLGSLIVSILGIVIALASVLYFQWWQKRKSLFCEIVSYIPWLRVPQEMEHRVQVLLDGKPIKNAYPVKMKVMNTGHVPIDDKDFVTPISVSFGENSEILTAEIKETSPSGLPAKIVPEKHCITVEPLMLNWGDVITIDILVSQLSNSISVDGRVKGIPQIKKRGTSDDSGHDFVHIRGINIMVIIGVIGWVLVAVPSQIINEKLISLEQLGFFRYILSLILAFLVILAPLYFLIKAAKKDTERQRKR